MAIMKLTDEQIRQMALQQAGDTKEPRKLTDEEKAFADGFWAVLGGILTDLEQVRKATPRSDRP